MSSSSNRLSNRPSVGTSDSLTGKSFPFPYLRDDPLLSDVLLILCVEGNEFSLIMLTIKYNRPHPIDLLLTCLIRSQDPRDPVTAEGASPCPFVGQVSHTRIASRLSVGVRAS